MTARILAILAAALFVATFALATLGQSDLSLGRGLILLDHTLLDRLHPGADHPGWVWLWEHVAMPFLVRPVWLLPAALGLLCAGGSATAASYGTPRSHRRRS
jgi:hypothetical protein